MGAVRNPILRGFNPDPSICRADDRFYIATSTFEWYPGVQIWESLDLTTWRLRRRALDEARLLDLTGVQSSGGVWAPCLSYTAGMFYLAFTVVKTWRGETDRDFGAFKDTLNFVVRSETIDGPWSDPAFINASGFDPSLFHDYDGKSWFLNMEWDYRGNPTFFSGILLQEFDRGALTTVGPIHRVFLGTEIGKVEGPHIYRRGEWYYLVTAEGGTGYEHAVTVARSQEITGPYTVHPDNPILTSLADRSSDPQRIDEVSRSGASTAPVDFYERPQRAGHASMCPISDDWVLVHLSGRPLPGTNVCPLGRETSIQRVIWRDDWPQVVDASGAVQRLAPALATLPKARLGRHEGRVHADEAYLNTTTVVEDQFNRPRLHPAFRFLRRDPGADASLVARGGFLRLIGRESPVSPSIQTVVALSVASFSYDVETSLEFEPTSFQQMAGLIVRYDERNQYYLRVAGDENGRRTLGILRFVDGRFSIPLDPEIELDPGPTVLGLEVRGATGQFYYFSGEQEAKSIALELDMTALADESPWPEGFTGTFVGLGCHDISGQARYADFSYFRYTER